MSKEKIVCPHCDKECTPGGFPMHEANCKKNPKVIAAADARKRASEKIPDFKVLKSMRVVCHTRCQHARSGDGREADVYQPGSEFTARKGEVVPHHFRPKGKINFNDIEKAFIGQGIPTKKPSPAYNMWAEEAQDKDELDEALTFLCKEDGCGAMFATQIDLDKHIEEVHGSTDPQPGEFQDLGK